MPPADVGVQATAAHPVSVSLPPSLSTSQPSPSQHQHQQQHLVKSSLAKQPTYFGIAVDFEHPVSSSQQSSGTRYQTSTSQHSHSHLSQTQAVIALIDSFFAQNKDIKVPPIWTTLKRTGRVQDAFHVTLVHANQGRPPSSPSAAAGEGNREAQSIYRRFCDLHQQQLILRQHHHTSHRQKSRPLELGPTYNIKILNLAWTDELMVLEVGISAAAPAAWIKSGSSLLASKSASAVCMNEVPHITIGTRSPAIPAVKSGLVLAAARHKNSSSSSSASNLVVKEWNIEPGVVYNQPLTAYP